MAEKMIGTGRVTPDKSRNACLKTAKPGEIVVCAPDDSEYRVQSSAQLDPESANATNTGALTPPDVAGRGIFKGKATISGKCFIGPCPKSVYMIDLSAIPDAPVGSDADKIAKGEIRAP